MNHGINQHQLIRKYNDSSREQFNDELFYRSDDDIINEIKKVILSCQRNRYFTIRVDKFTVIEDYDEIYKLLKEQEDIRLKNKNSEDNRYNYISLKDSDIKLLVVDYFIKVSKASKPLGDSQDDKKNLTEKNLRVLIEVPRIVDKYYFRIFGNIYSSMFQAVDGSTYNNSSAINSKYQSVTFKSMFMATRIYRYQDELPCTNSTRIKCVFFNSKIFNKSVYVMKYILARYGLYGAMQEFKVLGLTVTDHDIKDENMYTVKRHNLYVSLPKYIYDNDIVAQSLMYTVIKNISKDATLNDIFTIDYWIMSLGESFGNKSAEKGYAILDSLESIYDISTKESLMLIPEHKKDIYDVLIWIIRQFSELRSKDNLDISIKRIRYAEYIAALYALKLSTGIYRISGDGPNVNLKDIEKAIYTFPDYLLKQITKDKLVNYKNSVNDIDALNALKFTYKGVSGLGEQTSSIPNTYRQIHPSHIGRLDLDSSSASDPGLSGTICPLVTIYNGYFSDYSEPDFWREETDKIINQYRDLVGLKQALTFKKSLGFYVDKDREEIINDSINTFENLIRPIAIAEEDFQFMIEPIIYI